MPKVGKRYFPYTKKGKTAARTYAKKKGLKMRSHSMKMKGKKYKR